MHQNQFILIFYFVFIVNKWLLKVTQNLLLKKKKKQLLKFIASKSLIEK